MNPKNFHSKGEKALYGTYVLSKENKDPITVEDLAVKLWTLYPIEFCMKGYPEFPNVDIQKYLTKLFADNLIKGGVANYKITNKGALLIEKSNETIKNKKETSLKKDASISRELKEEIDRIRKSKVYKYYLQEKNPDFLEIDIFEFLGTSPRSLHDKSNSHFLSKLNLIKTDLVDYCKINKERDQNLMNILTLWNILNQKYGEKLK